MELGSTVIHRKTRHIAANPKFQYGGIRMKKCSIIALTILVLSLSSAFAQTKITLWGESVLDDSPDHAYAKALVSGFNAKYAGSIQLEYVALGNDGLKDKTKVAMASGSGLPELIQSWGGSTMGGYADAGQLADMTKELKSIPGSAAAAGAMTWKG
jgi:ABC-type glycerol-3-phosphate transport system substrate-binding protein